MNPLSIEGAAKTPTILADAEKGLIEIKGRSNPENTKEFYAPLAGWIDEYVNNPAEQTQVNIELEYFNTSSSKNILNLLRKLEAIPDSKEHVLVTWFYDKDDEEERETGEYYEQMTELSYKYVGI